MITTKCDFCNKEFKSEKILKTHQKKAKSNLKTVIRLRSSFLKTPCKQLQKTSLKSVL